MKRREFITLLGGAAVAWPIVASAQQAGKVPSDPGRVGPMARELVERNVDVLVALSPAAVAVRSLTSTIPIVAFDLETDPIGSGLVKSLARPGGNVTGVFFDFPEFSKKWLELLKETIPRLATIGVLWDPATGFMQLRAIEAVAPSLNIELETVEVRALADLEDAMAAASRNNVDALVMLSTPLIAGSSKLLAILRCSVVSRQSPCSRTLPAVAG